MHTVLAGEKLVDHTKVYYQARANGKSTYKLTCPFCNKQVHIQAWSAKSRGKKCDSCKSLIRLGDGGFVATKTS